MTEWDNIKKIEAPEIESQEQTQSEKKQTKNEFSDEKMKKWIFGEPGAQRTSSNVCCAIYGYDGTAKSGIAMDCRTEQERKEGRKIVIFDLDGGCAPLKVIYHDNDPNIQILNPLVRDDEKNIDYEKTFLKLKSALDYLERNMDELKIKSIIFDGLDRFLKICEYSMREKIGKSVEEGIDYRYWKLRNQKYDDILEQIKLMDVDRFFITHIKKDEDGTMTPDWQKKTPDMMFQKLRCYRETKVVNGEKQIQLKVEVEKCKTNVLLEGKEYVVAEIRQSSDGKSKAEWFGFRITKENTISQKPRNKE